MQAKDPGKAHFYASMIKSIARFGACGYLFIGEFQNAAIMFAVAEGIGIAEEIV